MTLEKYIRDVNDFPKKGILFKDIVPMLNDSDGLRYAVDAMIEQVSDLNFDRIGAFDARGFLFATPMGYVMNKPMFPIRKAGKLPFNCIGESYGLEYGNDVVEIQVDSVKKGEKVLLVDDLLATGGTMKAGCNLVEKLGGEVAACAFLIELEDLPGREKLENYDVRSLLKY